MTWEGMVVKDIDDLVGKLFLTVLMPWEGIVSKDIGALEGNDF